MTHTITYSKIKHWYVRILPDWTLKLSIPLRLKNDKRFEKDLLEKWKTLIEKIKEKNHTKIETFWEDFIVIFGEKIKKNTEEIQKYLTKSKKSINNYLKNILEQESIPLLDKYSKLIWFSYEKLTIKDLKSKRWSCTRDQKIVLNLKLLHIPKYFLEYVIIHEVCHLKEKNHSHRFWNLVESFYPNYKKTRKELKKYKF